MLNAYLDFISHDVETYSSDFFLLGILHLLLIIYLWDEVFISENPRMQWYCKLVMKIVFWTHKFAVRPIDMGNSESQDI